MNIDWNIVSAIGQVGGAVATFIAVIVALKQSKPKVKVQANVYDVYCSSNCNPSAKAEKIFPNRLYVSAVNVGTVPVKITKMGFRVLDETGYSIINPEPGDLPKILMPSEEVSIWTDEQSLLEKWDTGFVIAVAFDSAGRIYYQDVGIKRRITRFFWRNRQNQRH